MAFTVKRAKDAVRDILQDRPALAGVIVERGLPAKVPPAADSERIYVATTRGLVRGGPPGNGEDTFAITIMIEVLGLRGATHEATEDRMWALADEVDGQCREDPEWGIAVCGSSLTLDGEHTAPTVDKKGFVSHGVFVLTCTNRL